MVCSNELLPLIQSFFFFFFSPLGGGSSAPVASLDIKKCNKDIETFFFSLTDVNFCCSETDFKNKVILVSGFGNKCANLISILHLKVTWFTTLTHFTQNPSGCFVLYLLSGLSWVLASLYRYFQYIM